MNFSITRSMTHPAIVVVFKDEYDFAKDAPVHDQQLWDMLDQEDQPISVIVNTLDYKIGVEKLMHGTRTAMQSSVAPYQHRNCAALILVTKNQLLQISVDGFRKLGIAKSVRVAKSLDEALAMLS